MSVRGITQEMVRQALASPEELGMGYKYRLLAYKSFGKRRIKVVYIRENESYVIISVIWD